MADPDIDAPAADPYAQRRTLMAAALKQKVPLAVLDPTCQWTDTKDQAAVKALNNAGSSSDLAETSGVIYQNPQGQYCYSIPVHGKAEQFQLRVQSTPEQKLAGVYHTHPGRGEDAEVFSPDDVNVANQLKLQSYIKALQTGVVKRYDPGISKTQGSEHRSAGTIVPATNTTP